MKAVIVLCCATIVVAATDCESQCAFGITGISDLASMLENHRGSNDFCSQYAASVVAKDTWRECGYASLADAVEACLFGVPPKHCFRHKNAAIAVVVVSHIAAVAVWFPILKMISNLI